MPDALLDELLHHRRMLWATAYRMTGVGADADEVVQETFRRALEESPERRAGTIRPWLVRVEMNLARDRLRRRKREVYVGPWLPSPVPTDRLTEGVAEGPDVRYGRRESASFAFLVTLEMLTDQQRAVVLLRDVMDFSGSETAEILGVSENSVKVTLHRARTKLSAYEEARAPAAPPGAAHARLAELFACLVGGRIEEASDLIADAVRSTSDGGGKERSALRPIVGKDAVLRFVRALLARPSTPGALRAVDINGMTAFWARYPKRNVRDPECAAVLGAVDRNGAVREIYIVTSPEKLSHVEVDDEAWRVSLMRDLAFPGPKKV